MNISKLQQSALKLFAAKGFDGTSMSQIAEGTGIRKASIYAHFKSKEELYLSLVAPVIQAELDYSRSIFPRIGLTQETLYEYLEDFPRRITRSPYLPFLLRAMFLPPVGIHEKVMEQIRNYAKSMERVLMESFAGLPCMYDASVMAGAYYGIMECLQAEILYGTQEDFTRRLSHMWQVFELSITGVIHEND